MSDITLSDATRSALFTVLRTTGLADKTSERLSTGKRVNSVNDDAPAYFQAQALSSRAGDLLGLKDGIGQSASALGGALGGVDAIADIVSQLKGIALAAKGGTVAERGAAAAQFDALRGQIDSLAADASFGGINLISFNPDNLTTPFNETGTSSLTISGIASDSSSLGIGTAAATYNNFITDADIDNAIGFVNQGVITLGATALTLGSNVAQLNNRLDFTRRLVSELQTGADKLISADLNEEAAKLLSLQATRELGIVGLNIANQSQQAVLQLF
ncbi:MAG: flagellin [Rhodospirillales bacterium]|nr:flagellin [Rhodospirillales bacterium]